MKRITLIFVYLTVFTVAFLISSSSCSNAANEKPIEIIYKAVEDNQTRSVSNAGQVKHLASRIETMAKQLSIQQHRIEELLAEYELCHEAMLANQGSMVRLLNKYDNTRSVLMDLLSQLYTDYELEVMTKLE